MDYKLNLITPSLYSNVGPTNCYDKVVERFAHHLKYRSDTDFNLKCKYDHNPGLAFIHRFEDFEERFLIHSEYAVIIASPSSQTALNRFMPRLLVFLTAKPIWQNRFLFVILGQVNVLSNLVVNDPIEFSMNNWEDHDEESWIKLFDLIKIKWEPHVEKCNSEIILKQTSHEDSINEQNNSTKESQSLSINELDSDFHKNIDNTTLKTEKIDGKTISSNGTFSTESQSKMDESVNNDSDLHGFVAETGNYSFQKNDLWKENYTKENTEMISEEENIIDNTLDKTKLTIDLTQVGETNSINVANTLNTSHEESVKEENLHYGDGSLSDELNNDNSIIHNTQGDLKDNIEKNDNDSSLLLESKTNDNAQIKEGIVQNEETLRIIRCASRKLQGSSVTLENILYFQSDKPISNEPKIFESREMNTNESIFKNRNNSSNEKELPTIIEHTKENVNVSPLLSNQSSCTDSEQTFECDLEGQIIEEQDDEYEIQNEKMKNTSREFNFQSEFDNEEEKQILKEKNSGISLIENEKVEKGMVDDNIIVDSNLNFEETIKVDHSNLDQISTGNLENIEYKQTRTDKEYSNLDNSQDDNNKSIEMKNNSNFTVSNQSDKITSTKTKDGNLDVDIICSGIEFGKTNEVSIDRSVSNKDDVELNMSSREKDLTLLELKLSNNELSTSIDHKINKKGNSDSNVSEDFSDGFDSNLCREVSDNLHLFSVENLKTDDPSNFNNNNNTKIDTDVKSILNISEDVNDYSINIKFDEISSLTIENQGYKTIDNIGGEIKPSGEPCQTDVNKENTETNEHAIQISLDRNEASTDKELLEKCNSLSGYATQSLTENNNLDKELNNNETLSSVLGLGFEHRDLDNNSEISIDNKINLDLNLSGAACADFNSEVSDDLQLRNVGDLVKDESGNIINNKVEIDSKIDKDLKLIPNIIKGFNEDEMFIDNQKIMNTNLDESSNLRIDNQEANSIVAIDDKEANSIVGIDDKKANSIVAIDDKEANSIVGINDKAKLSEESCLVNINKEYAESNENIDKTRFDIINEISENLDSLRCGNSQFFTEKNIFNTELKNNETINNIDIGLEHRGLDNKLDISIDENINLQENLDSNITGDSNVRFSREVSDSVGDLVKDEFGNIINNNIAIDSKIDKDLKLIPNIIKGVNEDEMFINNQKNTNTNLGESSNLRIDNQEANSIVGIDDKTKLSEESCLVDTNKEYGKTNENIDKTSLNRNNTNIAKSNILGIGCERSDLGNEEISIKTDNKILVLNKSNEKVIDNESETDSKETEFVSRVITDVDNRDLELQRKELGNRDYKNESVILEITKRVSDEIESSNHEALQSTIRSDTGFVIDKSNIGELDLNIKGSDENINKETLLSLGTLSDSSEQNNMNIGSRIHFTSDDIDINLFDKESKDLNYGMIEEETKESMEEENYISTIGENQINEYCTLDDFQGDQTRSQFTNEPQFSLEISPSHNKNNSNLYFVKETYDNLIEDQCKSKAINECDYNKNEQENKDYCSITRDDKTNINKKQQLENSYEEINLLKNIETGAKFESENDDRNMGNKSTLSIFRIPLNCLYGLKRIPKFLCTIISPNKSRINHVDNEQLSSDTENSLTRCLHSPWCVLVLFVTGTLASPYWVEMTRNISESAVGADLIIDKISSTILHEDSVNRKYAILPLENH